jgi:hypothetical protein
MNVDFVSQIAPALAELRKSSWASPSAPKQSGSRAELEKLIQQSPAGKSQPVFAASPAKEVIRRGSPAPAQTFLEGVTAIRRCPKFCPHRPL